MPGRSSTPLVTVSPPSTRKVPDRASGSMANVFRVAWSEALPGFSSQGRLPSPPSELMLDSTRALKLSAVVRTWATLAFSSASVPSLAAERRSATTIRATRSTAAPATAGTRRSRTDIRCSFDAGFWPAGQRVGDDESRAAALGRGDGHLATHGGRELADDGESQPSPARGDDGVSPSTEEAGEDLFALGLRDAGAFVLDRELHAPAPLRDGDADDRAGGRVLRRVTHQVGHDTLHCLIRTSDTQAEVRLVTHQVVGSQVGLLVEDAAHDLAEVQDRVGCHQPGPALEAREVQQVLDQRAEALGIAVDLLREHASFLGAEAVPAGREELRVAG